MNYLKQMICVFLACVFCVQSEEAIFTVGTTSGYAPYVSLNDKGEYEGFDIDVAHLVAERLHKKLVLKDLGSMPSLLMALQKKKIDAAIWAISITEERQKSMSMIYYQGEKVTELPFVFWKEVPKGLSKMEDFKNTPKQTVCVETGSYQDSITSKYSNLKIRNLDKIIDAIMELKYGKCMAVVVDYSLLGRLQSQYPELKVAKFALPASQQSLGYGICINPSNESTTVQVSKIVADLQAEGKLAELEKKWGLAH